MANKNYMVFASDWENRDAQKVEIVVEGSEKEEFYIEMKIRGDTLEIRVERADGSRQSIVMKANP